MPAAPAGRRLPRAAIGKVSQAFWVIPEAYGTGEVRGKVREYTGDARVGPARPRCSPSTASRVATAACTPRATRSRPPTQYRAWIKQVAAGLRGTKALVVLEPDALPLFSSPVNACPTKPAGWQGMLRFATKRLSRSGAWVYLDAGPLQLDAVRHPRRAASRPPACSSPAASAPTSPTSAPPPTRRGTPTHAAGRAAQARGQGQALRHRHLAQRRRAESTTDVINPTWARLGQDAAAGLQGRLRRHAVGQAPRRVRRLRERRPVVGPVVRPASPTGCSASPRPAAAEDARWRRTRSTPTPSPTCAR